ncbi:PTS lactose/cellobiose transporter subunit IIA [Clostridium nigeriense]|uniref:PTS lactose/cellobiose transporter subunit IIA n=1 Tax=Clostridium nigeriense TaxID=1805470 RepID=UPI003D347B77
MNELELVAFEIISNVGMAKSLAMEAIREARNGNFEEAEKKIDEAKVFLLEGHHAHFDLIQDEANGKKIEFSLIIMHAEDQLMSAETIKDLAIELIEMNKEIKKIIFK